LIFDPVRGIPPRRLNTCPVSLPGLVNGGPPFAFQRFVLDPVAAPCGGRAFDVLVWSELAEGCSP
jgi:hypothetical protein